MPVIEILTNNIDRLVKNHLRRIDGNQGVYRDVYRIQTDKFGSDYRGEVVKIAKRKRAIEANCSEFQTWMSVSGTKFEKFFCPIRDRSEKFEFIIMDCVDTKSVDRNDLDKIKEEIRDNLEVEEVPVGTQASMDIHLQNIGLHSKKGVVIIDYPWGGSWIRP